MRLMGGTEGRVGTWWQLGMMLFDGGTNLNWGIRCLFALGNVHVQELQ
jgi:hypothetical protein